MNISELKVKYKLITKVSNTDYIPTDTMASVVKAYNKGGQDTINLIEEKLNNTGAEIIFNLPVEEILGEDIDLDDFAMLVQDAVQVYRKMVLGVLKQLKEGKE